MKKYSVTINGHRTSYSLEAEFHRELQEIARQQEVSMALLIRMIDEERTGKRNLSSALRLKVLNHLKKCR
jgi:predicted DNA-binding ribbon-helix-helix protein